MNVIEVKNISFRYNDENETPVLDDVSFSLEEGKYISIIGHNGSGKSTLAKILVGLLNVDKGTIKAFNLEYKRENREEIRKRIGIVFQNPDNQFIGSTVEDDIAFGLENHQVKHEEMQSIIDFYLKEVGMYEYRNKEPEMLSGGQKQRVAIAGVLAMHPDIIIFDEATAMLDPSGRKDVYDTIARLKEKNPKLTLISITHDIEEAFNSDEIVVLNKGKLFLKGTPEEVLENHQELNQIGLDIPFLYSLKLALNEKGLKVNEYKDIEGMVKEICE